MMAYVNGLPQGQLTSISPSRRDGVKRQPHEQLALLPKVLQLRRGIMLGPLLALAQRLLQPSKVSHESSPITDMTAAEPLDLSLLSAPHLQLHSQHSSSPSGPPQ